MRKTFHLGIILSVYGGRLVSPTTSPISGVYQILNHMTGESLFTHQLPRARIACKPYLLKQMPWLSEIDENGVGPENWRQWLEKQVTKYGELHEVESLPVGVYESRDPIAEAVEMMGPERVIVVKSD